MIRIEQEMTAITDQELEDQKPETSDEIINIYSRDSSSRTGTPTIKLHLHLASKI
jgi:hypothetical protein